MPARGLPIRRLVCAECEATSNHDAKGWRAYLDVDRDVAIYCPDCAEREFDG